MKVERSVENADVSGSGHKPRNARSPEKLEETRNGFFPRAYRGNVTLSIP